jgi:D-aspartate ligase
MLQDIVPGPDSSVVSYSAYARDGKALGERIPEVVEPGRKILGALRFHGFACTEFKLDARDGVYKLMDLNGRPNLSGLLAVRCGGNFPLMHYRHLAEGVIPARTTARRGRYWTDAFRDAGYSLAYCGQEQLRPSHYLAPYARRHCDAIFDRRDPGPALARLRYLMGNIGSTARAARTVRIKPGDKSA